MVWDRRSNSKGEDSNMQWLRQCAVAGRQLPLVDTMSKVGETAVATRITGLEVTEWVSN